MRSLDPICCTKEETDDITSITSLSNFPNLTSLGQHYAPVNEALTWLESESDCDNSTKAHCDEMTFYRTDDHLPRIRSEFRSDVSTNSSDRVATSSLDESQIPRDPRILRSGPDEISLCSSLDITLEMQDSDMSDDPNYYSQYAHIDEPRYHSIRQLTNEIDSLRDIIGTNEGPTTKARMAAEALISPDSLHLLGKLSESNGDGVGSIPAEAIKQVLNNLNIPSVTVNFEENEKLYGSLLNISVNNSEIISSQRKRSRVQKKKGSLCKPTSFLPEPDALEFFDPNKHVFQSANLDFVLQPTTDDAMPCTQICPPEMLYLFYDRFLNGNDT
ncbi:unnamed protein product [Protopolystoma xenopodis]|uniref:Protein phosphatase 1 regulatory subunit 35 C-terminal domain-containing protein n=1 Tax=Protopolystoma xenopodis TaxID=117903 RepID=A0A448XFU5_9PLAT|nr:unnamed protein product [Protopolystoma xenopodis]